MIILAHVSEGHINEGQPGKAMLCPIALAIHDTESPFVAPGVGRTHISLYEPVENEPRQFHSLVSDDQVRYFVNSFDEQGPSSVSAFTLIIDTKTETASRFELPQGLPFPNKDGLPPY